MKWNPYEDESDPNIQDDEYTLNEVLPHALDGIQNLNFIKGKKYCLIISIGTKGDA